MFNRWKSAILVYAVLLFIVGTALFHKLEKDDSFSPPSIFNDNAAAVATEEGPDFWEWETKTRFSSRRHEKDRICESFPRHILSHVQVVLKIGASEPADRVDAQMSTVTRCISNLLVVSDMESEIHGHRVHDVLADLPESVWTNKADLEAYLALKQGNTKAVNGQQGWNLDRMKFLPMVERAYDVNPTAKWYVFLESDTYYVWDNLFRLLDQYDPTVPLYFGSPSPGKPTEEETTWFAYGGSGFIISAAAMQKLVYRKTGAYGEFIQPSLSAQYEDIIRGTDCGDTVVGWALYEKGVKLSGLWPMFNAHALHSIPFDETHWCRPVISMHKTKLADMEGLIRWENERDRTYPLLYADLFNYTGMGTFDHRSDWDNADWGGWQESPESPAHTSFEACGKACHDNADCLSYTYSSSGHCFFIRSMRLGDKRPVNPEDRQTAGWDLEKMQKWRESHRCESVQWVKPSLTRIF
jgi:hypothetical protein